MGKRSVVGGKRRWVHVWVLAAFLFLLALQGGIAHAKRLKIGVLARCGRSDCLKKWTPTARYLSAWIPDATFEILPLSFGQVLPALRRGRCDFILTNPALYVESACEMGVGRIATVENTGLSGSCSTSRSGRRPRRA